MLFKMFELLLISEAINLIQLEIIKCFDFLESLFFQNYFFISFSQW